MSVAAANAAMDRMEADEAFAGRLEGAGGADASLEILRAEGFDVTQTEMRDALMDRYGDQLTTEQLDAIAGGKNTQLEQDIVIGGFLGFAAICAAAV